MTFEESLRRLKPIIGKAKADRLWKSYLIEDRDGKDNIYAWVKLKLEKALGQESNGSGNFLSVPPIEKAIGKYYLGDVVQKNGEIRRFGLREDEMCQHISLYGRSGSGKTNTVIRLIKELVRNAKPFTLFDWKQNYRDLLVCKKPIPLNVYTVGKSANPLRFNPLIPPAGTSPKVWLKKLIEITGNAFYLGEGVAYLLQEAIDAVYSEYGVYEQKIKHNYPTMQDVLRHLQEITAKGRKALWLDSALRALQTLNFGPISDVINVSNNASISDILNQNAILELDSLASAEKVFFIECLMVWIHHYRLTERKREFFKHAIIIEEAHNILNSNPTEKNNVINTLLREIREFGESIVLVDQHPSEMSIPAMGNTFCTIALNVKHSRDVQALADSMQVSYKDNALFGRLPVGQAVVKLQSRFNQPFLIEIPKEPVKKGTVTDSYLKQLYQGNSTDSSKMENNNSPGKEIEPIPNVRKEDNKTNLKPISESEELFLKDVLEYPLDGIVKRYLRLNISRRRGTSIKEKLIAKGALNFVTVPTQYGKVILLEPSQGLKQALEKKGFIKNKAKEGGLAHRYWKAKLKETFSKFGWKTEEEKSLKNGESVDVHIEKGNLKIAVEVEAGSRGLINIRKTIEAGYDYIFSFAINGFIQSKITKDLIKEDIATNKVILASPRDYLEQIKELTNNRNTKVS